MIDISSTIHTYKQLPFEQKGDKLISLLEIFAPYRYEINDVMIFIKQGKISEQDMIDIYTSFVITIDEIKKESLEKSLNDILSLHQKISAIHQAEDINKTKEGNPDDILKDL